MRLSLLTTLVLLPLLALLATPAAAQNAYTVLIGWQTLIDAHGPAWYSLFFYPDNLTIAYGDSVTWVWNSGEVHNVVFTGHLHLSEANPDGSLNPIAGELGNQTHFVDPTANYSSGIRNNYVAPTTLTFIPNTGSGSFAYYCSIHSSMLATINVLPAGQVAPLTPEQVNASTQALVQQLEAFADQEIASMKAKAPATGAQVTHTQLPDGTNEWTVIGGAMWMNGNVSMYARFMPSYIEINVNDTITWITEGEDPHYVYFDLNNDWPLIYTNWSHNQSTPVCSTCSRESPAYNLNPTFGPTGPITVFPTVDYPDVGIVNSGLIFDKMFDLPFPSSYSVRFTQVGSWPYQCPIHLDIGMIAEVVVKPAGAALCTDPSDSSTCAAVVSQPVSVLGDPQFVGLRGQSYQVHGIDGAVYALISEQHAQVNARFAFLTGPRACPSGVQQQAWSESEPATAIACWSHDGSYLSELGLFTPSARLFVQAGPAATGFATVDFNATRDSDELSYQRLSSHQLSVTLGSFTLYVDNIDGFVNLASVKPLKPIGQLSSHGLLGQTHQRSAAKHSGLSGVIEGEVDDYVVEGGLFAHDAMYDRYTVTSQ